MNNGNNLIIFDFDFTIAKTSEHILVVSPRGEHIYKNKKYRRLHPSEIQQLGIHDDESLDDYSYNEFYLTDPNKTIIIKPVLLYLKYFTLDHKVFILTARPNEAKISILNFLDQNNISIKNIEYVGLKNSSPSKKLDWIKEHINDKQYNELTLFEDNKVFIDMLLKIELNLKKTLFYIQNHINKTIINYYE